MRQLVWFSCGAASAVAAKLATEKYPTCEILYCNTLKYEHEDNIRFLRQVESWIGKNIKLLTSPKYTDIYDVFNKTGWLVGVGGARCTTELKKNVRKAYQKEGDIHIFGLTMDEEKRIAQFEDENYDINLEWILQTKGIKKHDCYKILQEANIDLPQMYKLGYNNNNCIGCVKGQMGYWNKIRIDFPNAFNKMAKQERKMNVAICKSYAGDGKRKRVFLDELDPEAGQAVPIPDIECGVLCVYNPEDRQEATEQHITMMANSNITSLINIALNKHMSLSNIYTLGLLLREITPGIPREISIKIKDLYSDMPDFCLTCKKLSDYLIPQGRITDSCPNCYMQTTKPEIKQYFQSFILALTTITGYQEREIRYLILKQVQKKESMNHE